MTDFISVYIAAANTDEAGKIGAALVEQHLAACVNIFPGVRSIYRWQGKVHDESEVILVAKTRKEHFEKLKLTVKSLHSYECPCIVATDITMGNQPYLSCITQETT